MGQSASQTTAPRTCSGAVLTTPNNLPPLTFHEVHGENIRITPDGTSARRVESFCNAVAFSARPVAINEKVCLRFSEVSDSWSGTLRFGFTSVNPFSHERPLPKYACPDLTSRSGYWIKALPERCCVQNNAMHFYVTSDGDVHLGLNGEEKGCLFSGVDTKHPLWAILDIYGNCTELKFIDPRAPSGGRSRESLPQDDLGLSNGLSAVTLNDHIRENCVTGPMMALPLHRLRGRNVRVHNERMGIVARNPEEFSQGYVFSARPIRPNETLVVQVLDVETAYAGSLAIGLTSCDPACLRPCDLPDDAELLVDRPEYWVIRPDAGHGLRPGDELSVRMGQSGEVRVSRGPNTTSVMHVDPTATLWAFVDLYGSTWRARIQLKPPQTPPPNNANTAGPLRVVSNARLASTPVTPGSQGPPPPGTLLLVTLPPQQLTHQQRIASQYSVESLTPSLEQGTINDNQQNICSPMSHSQTTVSHCQTPVSHCQTPVSHCLPPVSHCQPQMNQCASSIGQLSSHCSNNSLANGISGPSTSSGIYSVIPEPQPHSSGATAGECSICCERAVDAVLYSCGHMCMCYACAIRQWRGAGHCPLCRARISDVIRTYRS